MSVGSSFYELTRQGQHRWPAPAPRSHRRSRSVRGSRTARQISLGHIADLFARPTPVLTGRGALRRDVERVQRLAGGHEQPVALRTAETDVTADLGQADAADELALGVPHRHPAVADGASGVA